MVTKHHLTRKRERKTEVERQKETNYYNNNIFCFVISSRFSLPLNYDYIVFILTSVKYI